MAVFRFRAGLIGLAAAIMLGPAPSLAEEETFTQRLRFYGHFTPTVLGVNDGVTTDFWAVDNSSSGGRLGGWYTGQLGDHTLKANVEISLGLRQSAGISQLYVPPLIDIDSQTLRKAEAILETERWGKFSVGQGSMGSDTVAESDLSGTGLANYVGIADTSGGFFFRTAAGTLSNVRIQDVFPTYDGGRSVRVRWDSPEIKFGRWGFLKFVGSIGKEQFERGVTLNDALGDFGLFYRNSVGQFALAGSAGMSLAQDQSGNKAPQIAGSFSLYHAPTGLNATMAAGSKESSGQYTYWKLGIRRNWFELGRTSVSVDIFQSVDTAMAGSRGRSYGIGVVQNVKKGNFDVFLGFRRHEYTGPSLVQHRDITSVMFGVKWVFRRLENRRTIFEGLWEG